MEERPECFSAVLLRQLLRVIANKEGGLLKGRHKHNCGVLLRGNDPAMGVVAYTFNPSSLEAEPSAALSLRTARAT